MKKALAIVALLLGAVFACGQALPQMPQCQYAQWQLCLNTSAPVETILWVLRGGAPASLVGTGNAFVSTLDSGVTLTRATARTCHYADGGLHVLSNNQLCVETSGLLVESSTANCYPSSATPASATITLGSTGSWTASVDAASSGHIAYAAGTATTTGLPCTASAGTDCTFTVSGTGTVTSTVTATVVGPQLENKGYSTSYMPNSGTGCTTRDAESAHVPNYLSGSNICVGAKLQRARGLGFNACRTVLSEPGLGWYSSFGLQLGGVLSAVDVDVNAYDTTATQLALTVSNDDGTPPVSYLSCNKSGGTLAVYKNGLLLYEAWPGSGTTGTGTGVLSVQDNQDIWIGADNSAGSCNIDGWLTDVCVGTRPEDCRVNGVRHAVAVGDSTTSGASAGGQLATPWPQGAQAGLPANLNWVVVNGGHSGDTVYDIKAHFESAFSDGGFSRCMFLGGANLVASDTPENMWDAGFQLLQEMRSAGCVPIVLTTTPSANYSGWTSQREATIEQFRAYETAYCASTGLPCLDGYALLGDGATPPALAPAYDSGDGLHPNQAGANVLRDAVLSAW